MTTKTFKLIPLTLFCLLSGCQLLSGPDTPFIEPGILQIAEKQSLDRVSSILFSDLLFDSPVGERPFSTLGINSDPKSLYLNELKEALHRLIKKENTLYSLNKLDQCDFVIKLTETSKDGQIQMVLTSKKKIISEKTYHFKVK